LLAVVVACAALVAAQEDFAFPCGTIYGWAQSEFGQGWQVQSLDFGSGFQSDPVQIDFDTAGEQYVGAVAGRSTRTIYFFSDQNIYLYEVDEESVYATAAYSNSDLSFMPWGYDDVSGHLWGTWTDQTSFMTYLAHFDFNSGSVEVSEAEVLPGATLFIEQSQRTIYQVVQADADKGTSLNIRVNMFAVNPPVNYTLPVYFPNAGDITIAQAGKTLSGGTTLVYDDQGNYIALDLATGVTQPSNTASISDFAVFSEAYYNYALGYYDGTEFDCFESDAACYAFWDVLNERFIPFNISISNDSGDQISPGPSQVYYATSC